MFWNDDLPVLNAFAEVANTDKFRWGPVEGTANFHSLAYLNLKQTQFMHMRCDTNYNGWWFSLIPANMIREIGLSLPMFIKWDDVEYGMRADSMGYKTVSFPTSFVWHDSWTRKNDLLDWQAYYHERNRLITALLYSKEKFPLELIRDTLRSAFSQAGMMRYSVCQMKLDALENILAGPAVYASDLPGRLPKIQQLRKEFPDSIVKKIVDYPKPRKITKTPRHLGRVSRYIKLFTGVINQGKPVRESAKTIPEQYYAPNSAVFHRLLNVDSALFTYADSDNASFYVRDPEKFKFYTKRITQLCLKLLFNWGKISSAYKKQHKDLVSKQMWEKFFFEK
jgi:galactofuranosylgalactofuranosylrhamnosyl-N-acetylglucosaminyl-diphospho-decaprenol beta-1,5/1,6-galactofuranosyltransferase